MPAFTLHAARCPSVLLAVAPCVCRCPLAAVVRKQSLHHRSSSRSAHHVPPTTTSVVFLLVWFSNLQSFVCLGISAHKQRFDFKYCFVLRGLVPEEIDRDYSRLPVVRPSGCSVCCTVTRTCACTCFRSSHKWSCRGVISVKWEEKMVTRR